MRKIVELAWELFKISLFVIGGGYAIIAVADRVLARRGWTEEGELLDRLPVFQMVPGLIATHTAVYVGRKVAGPWGAVAGVIAVALPAVAVFMAVSAGYGTLPLDNAWLKAAFAGLRCSLAGIIAATVVRTWLRTMKSPFAYSLMLLSLGAIAGLGVAIPLVLVAAMAVGIAFEWKKSCPPAKRFSATWLPLLLFLKYGLLGFGGGFVLVPMYLEDFVGAAAPYLQLGEEAFSNVMALSQMTPGPIGVNCATFFGYRLAGVGGALVASALLLLPGSLLAYGAFASLDRFRENRLVKGILLGVKPTSLALMLIALWAFAGAACVNVPTVLLSVACGILAYRRKTNVVLLIVASSVVSTLWQMV